MPVGSQPAVAVAVDPGTHTAYVANQGSHSVSQILGTAPVDTATAPTVSGVTPSAGSTTGGQSVVITGTGLTGATDVVFGATSAASYVVDSATQITATTATRRPGDVAITVITPGGTSPGS